METDLYPPTWVQELGLKPAPSLLSVTQAAGAGGSAQMCQYAWMENLFGWSPTKAPQMS